MKSIFCFSLILSIFAIEETVGAPKKIALLLKAKENAFYDAILQGARDRAEELQFEIVPQYGKNEDDWQSQVAYLRSEIKNFDGFVLIPNRSDAFEGVLNELKKAAKPVAIVDTPLTRGQDLVLTTISSDNRAGGRLAGKYMVNQIGVEPEAKGCIALFSGNPNAKTHQDRNTGFKEILKQERPDLRIIEYVALSNREKAKELTRSHLSQIRKCYGVFAGSDTMILGVLDVFEQSKLREPAVMVGYDAILEVQKKILESKIRASIQQSPSEMGRTAIDSFANFFNREPLEKVQIIEPKLALQSLKLDGLTDKEFETMTQIRKKSK